MKKTILAVFTLSVLSTSMYAQSAAIQAAGPADGAVASAASPTAAEASDEYKDWKLTTAWRVTGADEQYILEMQKGEEKTTLKFNKDGKKIS